MLQFASTTDKASGEKIGEAFEHVTVAEGEDALS